MRPCCAIVARMVVGDAAMRRDGREEARSSRANSGSAPRIFAVSSTGSAGAVSFIAA